MSNMHYSKRNPADEFYTDISMIENEIKRYKDHFKDKVVLCNCDDPYESDFFKYFAIHFNSLKIKKLITTCYSGSPESGNQLDVFQILGLSSEPPRKALKIEINEVKDYNGDGAVDLADVEWLLKNDKNVLSELKGDGDFRSNECVELMKEADIIVTNPPFSTFRSYMTQLLQSGKKFLIIGRNTCCTYKEIWPYFLNHTIWMGYTYGHFWFRVPDYYQEKRTDFKIDKNGQKWRRMGNICWYTNMDYPERHEDIILYRHYNADDYPEYDNYYAIEVNSPKLIPKDFDGVMGVNTDFLCRWNPSQFEVLGFTNTGEKNEGIRHPDAKHGRALLKGKEMFTRILIRRKK